MTNDEANKALHESRLVGGCWHDNGNKFWEGQNGTHWYHCNRCDLDVNAGDKLPNYCESYDAVIPVVQGLDEDDYIDFAAELHVIKDKTWENIRQLYCTPRDIVDALLKLIEVD